jgi:hypothetical protein
MNGVIVGSAKGGNEAQVIDGELCVEIGTDDLGSGLHGAGPDGVIADDDQGGDGARVTGGRLWVEIVP